MSRVKRKKLNKQSVTLLLMMAPALIYLLINNYIPMAGLCIAFKKYDYSAGIWKSKWCGLSNFTYLFKTSDSFIMIRNTLCYNLVFIALGTAMSVAIAVLLDQIAANRAKKIYQVLILIPYLISMVVVSYIVYAFLNADNGFINKTILGGARIGWYTMPGAWPVILTIVYLWKTFGYLSIIYYATIIGIDTSLYESAALDGAGRWQKIWHVTIPGLKTTIITMTLLSIGRVFYSDFGLFYQVPMDSGLLYNVTTTIDVYVYKGLTQLNDIGRSAAAGFVQSICGFLLVMASNLVVRKIDDQSALF